MQVIMNLLSNAVKFCPRGGRVEVRLAPAPDGRAGGRAATTAPGSARPTSEIIFEKFRQVSDTLTGKPRGTGLGLPISRQIVEHFGGRLWVESELGQGATFSFVLPLDAAPVRAAAEDEALSQAQGLKECGR